MILASRGCGFFGFFAVENSGQEVAQGERSFTGSGVPLTQQWVSVEDKLRHVRMFFRFGTRMVHVTCSRPNRLRYSWVELGERRVERFRTCGGVRD